MYSLTPRRKAIVSVSSSSPAVRLDRATFELASKTNDMKHARQRFGRALIELGVLSQEELEDAVRRQIEAIIYSVIQDPRAGARADGKAVATGSSFWIDPSRKTSFLAESYEASNLTRAIGAYETILAYDRANTHVDSEFARGGEPIKRKLERLKNRLGSAQD